LLRNALTYQALFNPLGFSMIEFIELLSMLLGKAGNYLCYCLDISGQRKGDNRREAEVTRLPDTLSLPVARRPSRAAAALEADGCGTLGRRRRLRLPRALRAGDALTFQGIFLEHEAGSIEQVGVGWLRHG
jgi:hypothetical protein